MSTFHHTRQIAAQPREVFAAIENPKRLARWWGPNSFTNSFHTFEFKPGGQWLFTMHGPDGKSYENQSEFLEITAPSLVRIKHVNLPHFELTIKLLSHEGGTLVDWTGVFEDKDFAEKMRSFLESANEQNLDRLADEVAGK